MMMVMMIVRNSLHSVLFAPLTCVVVVLAPLATVLWRFVSGGKAGLSRGFAPGSEALGDGGGVDTVRHAAQGIMRVQPFLVTCPVPVQGGVHPAGVFRLILRAERRKEECD